jgi:hypothetical protein
MGQNLGSHMSNIFLIYAKELIQMNHLKASHSILKWAKNLNKHYSKEDL